MILNSGSRKANTAITAVPAVVANMTAGPPTKLGTLSLDKIVGKAASMMAKRLDNAASDCERFTWTITHRFSVKF